MKRSLPIAIASLLLACGDQAKRLIDSDPRPTIDGSSADARRMVDGTPVDAGMLVDAASVDASTCERSKLTFAQELGCANDGSVEFCIPAGHAEMLSQLAAINPAITCNVGGGRADCLATPGLLLCMYPTNVPDACVADNGAMTNEAWADMCTLSLLPFIAKIVPTLFE